MVGIIPAAVIIITYPSISVAHNIISHSCYVSIKSWGLYSPWFLLGDTGWGALLTVAAEESDMVNHMLAARAPARDLYTQSLPGTFQGLRYVT